MVIVLIYIAENKNRRGRDRMEVGFTTTCAISTYHWWFSLGTSVSCLNKADRHDITEILLKVTLNATNGGQQ